MRKLLLLLPLVACSPAYVPADMATPVTRLGCVDINITATWPAESTGPVAVIDLGNRCEHGVVVDLGAIHAVAEMLELTTTRPVVLAPYDPRHEIRPRTLGPGVHGAEWIEYHPVQPMERIDRLVFDVAGVVPGETTKAGRVEIDAPARPSSELE